MSVIDVKEVGLEMLLLLARVRAGDEVLISDGDQPVARVVPASYRVPREFGYFKGRVWMADDFNEPLPPDIQAGFERWNRLEGACRK